MTDSESSSGAANTSGTFTTSESFSVLGFAKSIGDLPLAFMLESGKSDYNSTLTKGSVSYTGLSILARLVTIKASLNSRLYFDLGGRAGTLATSLTDNKADGLDVVHETSSTYFSVFAHSGLDYHLNNSLDAGGFLRINSLYLGTTKENLNANDTLSIGGTTTSRLQMGFRSSRTMFGGMVSGYVEIGGEYQTGDNVKGTYTYNPTNSNGAKLEGTPEEIALSVSGLSIK
jgi:hypothetical protein